MSTPRVPDDNPSGAEEDDDEADAETIVPGKGPNREEMVSKFLPAKHDWDAKTQLDLNDPANLALMRNYSDLMPELDHMQDTLDNFASDFVKSRTSVGGLGRQQYVDIFRAMFGVDDSEDDAASMLAEAFGAGDDED